MGALAAGFWGFVGGASLLMGALMDGIPESAAIGISLLEGGSISIALVAAVFLSFVLSHLA